MSEQVPVILYTRRGCSLCERARASIRAAESLYRLNIDLREVDIDADPELTTRFTDDVPVIHVRGREAFRHTVDPAQLAAVIRDGAAAASVLATESCVPCRGGVPPLQGPALRQLEQELGNGWVVVGDHHLEKQCKFPDFAAALAFTNQIGAVAEQQGHHPDVHLSWGSVRIELWTHAIDGLTRSDFILAAKIDELQK